MEEKQMQAKKTSIGFPKGHVIGLILSLALTFAALSLVLAAPLAKGITIIIITILAVLQAIMQLFMFMHITESENGKIQVVSIIYSFFIAICIIAGTVWILAAHFTH